MNVRAFASLGWYRVVIVGVGGGIVGVVGVGWDRLEFRVGVEGFESDFLLFNLEGELERAFLCACRFRSLLSDVRESRGLLSILECFNDLKNRRHYSHFLFWHFGPFDLENLQQS